MNRRIFDSNSISGILQVDNAKRSLDTEAAHKIEPASIRILNDLSVACLGVMDFKNARRHNTLALRIDRGNYLAVSILEQINRLRKFSPACHPRYKQPNPGSGIV